MIILKNSWRRDLGYTDVQYSIKVDSENHITIDIMWMEQIFCKKYI